MLSASIPVVQNIKIGFRIEYKNSIDTLKKNCEKKSCSVKHYHNFSVIRDRFVFSIFWKKGYVNVTKLKCFSHIEQTIVCIISLLDLERQDIVDTPIIHNICASGRFSRPLNLTLTKKKLEEKNIRTIKNLSFFPALFVKIVGLGTVVCFQNGKYSLVGVNTEEKVHKLIDCFLKHINNE